MLPFWFPILVLNKNFYSYCLRSSLPLLMETMYLNEIDSTDKNLSPHVSNYKNVLDYFSDYYKFRKHKDHHFSYSSWALEIGIGSRSYLKLVTAGKKNISDQFINLYSKSLQFSKSEAAHFDLICQYHNLNHSRLKRSIENSILENREIKSHILPAEEYASVAENPLSIAIQALLGTQDQKISSALLSEKLKVHLNDVEVALFNFYSKSLDESKKKLKEKLQNPSEESCFRGVFLGISESDMPEVRKDLEDFIRKIKSKYTSKQISDKKLVKFNFNYYPISEKF